MDIFLPMPIYWWQGVFAVWKETVAAPPQPPRPRRRAARWHRGEDRVLLGQVLLCLAVLALAAAAKGLQWPVWPQLRQACAQALQPDQGLFLAGERSLAKFTEEAVQTLSRAADALRHGAEDARETAATRAAHAKTQPAPSGAREEAYFLAQPLVFPLAGGRAARTSGYGWRTDPMGGSGSDFHLGNDLAAAEGTAVLAAAGGVVRVAGTHSSYGNYLRILHADGDETLYAHLQYLFVRAGQRVEAGQRLGTVGQTGNTTGPHLHFELLHRGIRYDPTQALQNAA